MTGNRGGAGNGLRRRWRCWFAAWVLGWALSIYLASGAIALLRLSPFAPPPVDLASMARITFEIADLVSPWAKILPGALMLLGFGLVIRGRPTLFRAMPRAIAVALAATLATLAWLPAPWSRGFGIGLSGTRFDPALVAVYLSAAGVAGIAFAIAHHRCDKALVEERSE